MNDQLATIFLDNWSIYQRIITFNYMRHKEFAAETFNVFNKLEVKEPLEILDLGCGDAQPMTVQLKQLKVGSYTGYDLSDTALEFARLNLQPFDCKIALRQGPMQTLIHQERGSFDVIYSSYAIHHLLDDQKASLLQDCYNKLSGKGCLIMIDLLRDKNESLHHYIDRYIDDIKNHWVLLSAQERELIYNHMRQYDFPAVKDDMMAWASKIGFLVEESPVNDGLNKMLVLTKP